MMIALIVVAFILAYVVIGMLVLFFGVRRDGVIQDYCTVGMIDVEPYFVVGFWPFWAGAEIFLPVGLGIHRFLVWLVKTGVPSVKSHEEWDREDAERKAQLDRTAAHS